MPLDEPGQVLESSDPPRLPLTKFFLVFTLWLMADMQTIPVDVASGAVDAVSISMNIGTTIRGYRLQKGMSQGDIEKRTGLLRCYLSRVENGHTVPSLETLQKIARALDLQLSEFFAEEAISKEMSGLNLGEEEIRFLTQVQRYSAHLSDSDRRLLLAMVRKFAQTTLS
jgi:transcriptional regulator with XRE-family HTH domain